MAPHRLDSPAPERRGPRLALLVLAGCAAWPLQSQAELSLPKLPSLPSLPNPFKPAPEKTPPPAPDNARAAATNVGLAPLVTRPEAALVALFEKRTVNGSELIAELTAMRALMHLQHSPSAVAVLLGTPEPPANGASDMDLSGIAIKKGLEWVDGQVKPYTASIGFAALDDHMASMIDDPQRLARETITLPSPKGLSPQQMQRVATMAAIVVATRITGQVLKKAHDDFASIEGDYARLIERREKAASLLYGVLLSGVAGATELNGIYADNDLKFLRDNVAHMSVKEFANDMGAQNLALRFLQKTDRAAYDDYKARSDGTLAGTRGYIRTTAGGAAFGALLVTFVQQSTATLHDRQASEMAAAFPFALQFVKELPPVVKAAWAAGAAGIVEVPMKANKRFRVIDGAGSADVGHSAEVFAAMKKQGEAEPIFTEALFRNGGDGLLYKVYRCDRAEAGRLLDVAVPMDERDRFANDYIAHDLQRYSFVNSFTLPGENARERELGDELLRDDQRAVARRVELGKLQRVVTGGYNRWGDEQLMRLIFANREGGAAQATLQLGDWRVRPIPSAQSVFAYESLIDGCGQQFGGGGAPAAGAPARPGSPVSPVSPVSKPGTRQP